MIRCSVNNDREGLISLWNEAFSDTRDNIEFFLDNKYIADNTVVCEKNGKIVSQLFLLEGEMHINGTDYPSYYLYAACTLKEQRGKGIMGKMLEFSRNLAYNRGKFFICLMPAEESLFGYYSKFGYKSLFERKIIRTNIDELNKIDFSYINYSDFGIKSPVKSRDTMLENQNYFKWDKHSIDFAFRFIERYDGCALEDCKGYMLYDANNGYLSVKENTFTQGKLAEKVKMLCDKNQIKEFEIILPVNYDFFGITGDVVHNGMILDVKDMFGFTDKTAYLGLTLD